MREVIRSADPRIAALIARQATQRPDNDGLGLERITALLDALGRPQDGLPPVFHVAGTNGKGSTCAFLRAALEAAGHRVHAFTSPHLVRYNERIRLAGTLIDDDRLGRLMGRVLDSNEAVGGSLFEVNVAVALLAFAEVEADAVILEVGLGGRLDATNVVDVPLVTGIASLGLDHQAFLGDTLVQIAAEKAGIAKRGVPLVTQRYAPEVAAIVAGVADAEGARWEPRGRHWDAIVEGGRLRYQDQAGEVVLPLPTLAGAHQADNAALAVAMLRHQDTLAVHEAALAAAMALANWPARLQRLGPGPLLDRLPRGSELWLDGGHNPAAAARVADHAATAWRDGLPLVLVFASLASKDGEGILRAFDQLAPDVVAIPIEGHDCRAPEELTQTARALGFTANPALDLPAALGSIAYPARVLIFGSLYLAGEALALNGEQPD